MIDILQPRLCTWWAKWAERPPKIMKQSQRDETPFRYAYAEIRTRVVVIYDPTRDQLNHGGGVTNGKIRLILKAFIDNNGHREQRFIALYSTKTLPNIIFDNNQLQLSTFDIKLAD